MNIAEYGVLNAHSGMLPPVRGMNAAEWSLLAGIPLGDTVHRIDSGIDTGPVFAVRTVDMSGVATIDDARALLVATGIELLVEVAADMAKGKTAPCAQPLIGTDLQHFFMHNALKRLASRMLERSIRGEMPSPIHLILPHEGGTGAVA